MTYYHRYTRVPHETVPELLHKSANQILKTMDKPVSNIRADEKSVTFTLENTGTMDGAEVAQVYVSCQDGKVFRPQKELPRRHSRLFGWSGRCLRYGRCDSWCGESQRQAE